MARLITDDLAQGGQGKIDPAAADHLRWLGNDAERLAFDYFLAKYFDLHRQPQEAIRLWKRCVQDVRDMQDTTRFLAVLEYQRHGLKGDDLVKLVDTPPPQLDTASPGSR